MIAKLCGEYLKIGFPANGTLPFTVVAACCESFTELTVNKRQIDPNGFRDPTIHQINTGSPEDRSVLGGGNLRRREGVKPCSE